MAASLSATDDLSKTLATMAAQLSELARRFDALEPLVPLASKLDGLPDRVQTLQASTFEYAQEVHALHIAVQRVEKSQRDLSSSAREPGEALR
ncbi:hypothetical protein E2562_022553 [Oryza meyeriana var. granulata]|uniref:Uncharacterized protein n=1 Tax=Oryza meyeriana var. granulata TaxID=110450 RepID=A0A6G1FB05_9ORYZ|nr:hypothetical protein E2562_022553 [Oryza meyeriana var. granulata]